MSYIQAVELIISVGIIAAIILLMIKKKSNSSVSLIWLTIAVVVLVQAIFPDILLWICDRLNISYPPTLVMITAIAGLVVLTFYISSELAVAQNKIRELTIHISMLNAEMSLLKTEEILEVMEAERLHRANLASSAGQNGSFQDESIK